MEDFVFTKASADGEWANINLSEIVRILQASNPDAKLITTGKEAGGAAGMAKAQLDRKRIKGRV